MLKLLETLKDSAESTFDSAASRVENVHRLISGYAGGHLRRMRGASKTVSARPEHGSEVNIYDVVRGVNREIGEFGTDLFEIIDDARARRAAEKPDSHKDSHKDTDKNSS